MALRFDCHKSNDFPAAKDRGDILPAAESRMPPPQSKDALADTDPGSLKAVPENVNTTESARSHEHLGRSSWTVGA